MRIWAKFKVMVPGPDGSQPAKMVAPPCITGITLTTYATQVRRADGSGRMTSKPHTPDIPTQAATTPKMTRTGSAAVVQASGALSQATAERIAFCADAAPLFERAMAQGGGVGDCGGKGGGVGWLGQ